jgi:BirA family transcriptional regulator, biotin operon repressor / biotin---[acetyl-CoA-carboxylase] ligase
MSFAGSAETLWQAVMALQQPSLMGFSVEILPEIDSTNSELMRRARAGRTEPTLLVALQQTAGRGRLGRSWLSGAAHEVASMEVASTSSAGPPQAASTPLGGSAAHEVASVGAPSLTFSLGLLLKPAAWDGLSLAVGTSLACSLHERVQLKWPNDLWLDGRKLAGILIETAPAGDGARYAVLGVGINLLPRPADGLSTAPAALSELLGSVTPAQVLERLAAPLLRDVLQFEREGFCAFASRFAARDALLGRAVTVLAAHPGTNPGPRSADAGPHTSGVAQGVNAQGALLLHTAAGVQAITSSEVSVRPAASPTH